MGKYMNGKKEDTITILTTFLVFSAIIDPPGFRSYDDWHTHPASESGK